MLADTRAAQSLTPPAAGGRPRGTTRPPAFCLRRQRAQQAQKQQHRQIASAIRTTATAPATAHTYQETSQTPRPEALPVAQSEKKLAHVQVRPFVQPVFAATGSAQGRRVSQIGTCAATAPSAASAKSTRAPLLIAESEAGKAGRGLPPRRGSRCSSEFGGFSLAAANTRSVKMIYARAQFFSVD